MVNYKRVLEEGVTLSGDEMAEVIESMGMSKLNGITTDELRNQSGFVNLNAQFQAKLGVILAAYIAKHPIEEV